MAGPWEKYQKAGGGTVITLPPDPEKQANSAREDVRLRIAQQEEARRSAEYNATHNPDGSPKDPAAQVGIPPEQMHVTGPDFLKMLSPSEAAQVKALAEGRMAFPAGKAASSPYWQQRLAQVSQYDPEFDAINYNARAATRRDFTAGKSSANIKALNTAIGHLGELYGQIDKTASHGGFPGATTVNAIQNAFARSSGSSGPTKYEQTAGALAGELTQVYRQSGGAEADIQRYLTELSPNASLEQKREAIKNMANLLRSRLDAINDQYTKGMGTTAQPLQVLDQHAQDVLGVINSGGALPSGGGNGTAGPVPRIPGSDASAPMVNAQGQAYSTPQDLALAKAVVEAYRKGGDLNAMFNAAKANGYTPNLQDAKAWQDAINSRDKGNPSGVLPRKSGQRSVAGQIFGQSLDNPGVLGSITRGVTAAGIGAGNGMTFGGLDEVAGGINSALGGGSYEANRDYANLGKNAMADVAPMSYLGGEAAAALTQGLLGGAVLGRAAPGAADAVNAGLRTTRGQVAAGGAYGAAQGFGENNQDRLGGAIAGGMLGAGGGLLGARVAAPLARKFFETDAGQMLSNNARALLNKVRPDSVDPTGNVPQFTPGERVLPQMDQLPGLTDKLQSAADLNLPYTLADAHPKLRNLAGSASRISPDARSSAEQFLEPRALGQADRAREGIDQYLAPITDIQQRGKDLLDAGNAASEPYYNMAGAQPPASPAGMDMFSPKPTADMEMQAILRTDAGRKAFSEAKGIASNRMSGTMADQVQFDPQGNPVFKTSPNFETADRIKKGFDQVLGEFRNPFTGQLDIRGNPKAQSILDLQKRFIAATDSRFPAYPEARAAYAPYAQRKEALDLGVGPLQANNLPQRQFDAAISRQTPETLPELQRGYATGMADKVGQARMSVNPYNSVYGSTNQQQRVGQLFPEGSDKFNTLYNLEGDMAKTRGEVLGGSPTAARQQADASFMDTIPGHAVEMGTQLATGGGLSPNLLLRLGKLAADRGKLGINRKVAETRANDLAAQLFNPNPSGVLDYIGELMQRQAAQKAREGNFRMRGGLFGSSVASSLPALYSGQ